MAVSADSVAPAPAEEPAIEPVPTAASLELAAVAVGWETDASVKNDKAGWEDASEIQYTYNPKEYPGSMYWVAQEVTGAGDFWTDGYTGDGVTVALVDSGVVPVNGLDAKDKVINGPDLSFESQADNLRYLDTFGHGTHMAGIIAGRDGTGTVQEGDETRFLGIAPDARILNVKVADMGGGTDVSQVIAAIVWVVEHRTDKGMDVRVLNLSYGTDGIQDYQVDPLAHAVERAWKAGIVVVVAAGNDGNSNPLRNPAIDPYVIAVGSAHGNMTHTADDDTLADFSNCGTASRYVDLVAPGKSIVGLRNPGSYADLHNPNAVVANRYFLGSGTSQSAAVVSGAAALIIQQRPKITPDQVKALLMQSAQDIDSSTRCQGAGMIDLEAARNTTTPKAKQSWELSVPTGSLEKARGSYHVYDGKVALEGEQDIMSNPWVPEERIKVTSRGASWTGGDWNGASWTGASWSGASWSGASWSGASWTGASWSGASWSSKSWSGASWSGASWSGASWSGASWSGASWSGYVWQGLSWD